MNLVLSKNFAKVFKKALKQKSTKNLNNPTEMQQCDAKYTGFKEYLDEHIPYKAVQEPKHVYTIELRNCVYSDEVFEVYKKYEKHVHKVDREVEIFKRTVCCSPVYDSGRDTELAARSAPYNWEGVDQGHESKN